MLNPEERKKIEEAVEKIILELNHPKISKVRPSFKLRIDSEDGKSWADLEPNSWNNMARGVLKNIRR